MHLLLCFFPFREFIVVVLAQKIHRILGIVAIFNFVDLNTIRRNFQYLSILSPSPSLIALWKPCQSRPKVNSSFAYIILYTPSSHTVRPRLTALSSMRYPHQKAVKCLHLGCDKGGKVGQIHTVLNSKAIEVVHWQPSPFRSDVDCWFCLLIMKDSPSLHQCLCVQGRRGFDRTPRTMLVITYSTSLGDEHWLVWCGEYVNVLATHGKKPVVDRGLKYCRWPHSNCGHKRFIVVVARRLSLYGDIYITAIITRH